MYTVKESYELLVGGNTRTVPMNILWNSCVPKSVLFCLGSPVGKSSNNGSTQKEGGSNSK